MSEPEGDRTVATDAEQAVERVRAALDAIKADDEPGFDAGPDYYWGLSTAARRIRAALDGGAEGGGQ